MKSPLKRFFEKLTSVQIEENDSEKTPVSPEVIPVAAPPVAPTLTERYYDNLAVHYGRIELEGFAIASPQQPASLPLEQIYIPLELTPQIRKRSNRNGHTIASTQLLTAKRRSIVSGPLGSGKSTLLRFLARLCSSARLQQRYALEGLQDVLPIIISLRDYEHQLRRNDLSLLDYMVQQAQNAFNLSHANRAFFETYLAEGRALLLFDGMNEVRYAYDQNLIRKRLLSLLTTYPHNRVVITTRTVDYRGISQFEPAGFDHYRLEPLTEPAIAQFVQNWHRSEPEDRQVSTYPGDALLALLRDPRYPAISPLAQNPLFLTVMTRVHNANGTLSNRPHLRYHRSVESLLETLIYTWPVWHYQGRDSGRFNHQKRNVYTHLAAVAYWMYQSSHALATDRTTTQLSTVKGAYLREFLAKSIQDTTHVKIDAQIANDRAETFIELVGSELEVLCKDERDQYQFTTLAFQEYLAASFIATAHPKDDAEEIWQGIRDLCVMPRWHGVLRLFLVGFNQQTTQSKLIDFILAAQVESEQAGEEERLARENRAFLLGMLLSDGAEAATWKRKEILRELCHVGCFTIGEAQLTQIRQIIEMWLTTHRHDRSMMMAIFEESLASIQEHQAKVSGLLLAYSLSEFFDASTLKNLRNQTLEKDRDKALFELFFDPPSGPREWTALQAPLEQLWRVQDALVLESAYGGLVGTILQSINSVLSPDICPKRAFEQQMILLRPSLLASAYPYLNLNGIEVMLNRQLATNDNPGIHVERALDMALTLDQRLAQSQERVALLEEALQQALPIDRSQAKALAHRRAEPFSFSNSLLPSLALDDLWRQGAVGQFWEDVLRCPALCDPILTLLVETFSLEPTVQWRMALQAAFLPHATARISLFSQTQWQAVDAAFMGEADGADGADGVGDAEQYHAAWRLLLDAWLCLIGYYRGGEPSICENLVELTEASEAAPLRVAHAIRGLAYGDESKRALLAEVVQSDMLAYRDLFEACLWVDTK